MGDWTLYVVAGLLITFVVIPVIVFAVLHWLFRELWR